MADSEPKRIQRRRTKGWKMPPNTVYVGRPTEWGNPYYAFTPKQVPTMLAAYRDLFTGWIKRGKRDITKLRGKNLACWCRLDQPCHADVLLEMANSLEVRRG